MDDLSRTRARVHDEQRCEMSGIDRIAAERRRQIEQEGWTVEHDATLHSDGVLCFAAAGLVLAPWQIEIISQVSGCEIDCDPWHLVDKHGANRQRQLEIAGALIAAELDRLER